MFVESGSRLTMLANLYFTVAFRYSREIQMLSKDHMQPFRMHLYI
jgi:hypothetical protein